MSVTLKNKKQAEQQFLNQLSLVIGRGVEARRFAPTLRSLPNMSFEDCVKACGEVEEYAKEKGVPIAQAGTGGGPCCGICVRPDGSCDLQCEEENC